MKCKRESVAVRSTNPPRRVVRKHPALGQPAYVARFHMRRKEIEISGGLRAGSEPQKPRSQPGLDTSFGLKRGFGNLVDEMALNSCQT
ncbi:hypothetical protein MRX96_001690 [Rhipicephalus microplus]